MLDSCVIVNEILHGDKYKKVSNLVSKVDYEKAYDSVR